MLEAVVVKTPVLPDVARGNPEAMAECLNRYGGLVWAMACRRCRSRADAEDVVQDIFLQLWKSAERFNAERSAEVTFVSMIARRRLIDYQRRQPRHDMEPLPADPVDPGSTRVDSLEFHDEVQRARQLLNQLRPDEKDILQLSIERGLSHSEIAERTKLPLGTIKSHARRGLIRLREMLGSEVREHASGARR